MKETKVIKILLNSVFIELAADTPVLSLLLTGGSRDQGDRSATQLEEEYSELLCDLPESSVCKFGFEKFEGADSSGRTEMVCGPDRQAFG